MKKSLTKIISIMLVAIILTGSVGIFNSNITVNAANRTNSQLEKDKKKLLDDQANLEKKQKEYEKTLKDLEANKASVTEQKKVLDKQMSDTQAQINTLDNIVTELTKQLEEQNAELTKSNKALDSYYEVYKDRIRDSYEGSDKSMMSVVLGSKSFTDYLEKIESSSQIVEYDNQLMDKMTVEINKIKTLKEGIEKNKADNESSLAAKDTQKTSLQSQITKSNNLMASIEKDANTYAAFIKQTEKDDDELQTQLAQIALENEANRKNSGDKAPPVYNGDDFYWPAPGFYHISSPFGWRKNPTGSGYQLHKGSDIAGGGIFNTPAYAIEGGEVIFSADGWNGGGGNMVTIDCGNGLVVTYMHFNSRGVSVGDTIKKGQQIGRIGTTGNSTGPHLHLQIMIYGELRDPMTFKFNK